MQRSFWPNLTGFLVWCDGSHLLVVTILHGSKSYSIGKPIDFSLKWCSICQEQAHVCCVVHVGCAQKIKLSWLNYLPVYFSVLLTVSSLPFTAVTSGDKYREMKRKESQRNGAYLQWLLCERTFLGKKLVKVFSFEGLDYIFREKRGWM